MNSVLFPAFKFLSLDYEYENFMKQKLATSWMLIPFPKEILKEEEYCHSNIFVNDLYRTPWKRYIVPSSNPCSQTDLEELCSAAGLNVSKDKHDHEECWRAILPTASEDYLLPEETVFVDHVVQFGWHVPRLKLLLPRLKTFPVQDPIVGWQRNLPAMQMFFRIEFCSESEGIFEKKISPIRPKTIIHKWNEQSPCNVSSVPVINPSSSQNNLIVMDACKNTDRSTGDDITVTHGQKTDQPKVSLPLLKFEKLNQYLTPTKEILSVSDGSQASTSQQRSCHSYKSLDGGLSGHDTQAKEDLLSHFIALRTRNTSDHSECKYEENVLSQVSQHQAYRVLQAAAEPVLKKLVCLEVFASVEWNFTSVSFDCTRFLLRKQEKIISDSSKLGNKSDKDEMIFKNAALLHILVTLRDLVLMCSLDATLEYLCKAQEKYKSVFGPYLDGMWRKLRIVQFVREKAEEPNPKVTALLNLRSYSCVISKNQYIGSSFPWAHFSLVVEYDCTDYWLQLCQKLNVSHITLNTSVPGNRILLTRLHDMSFLERSSNRSLHLFGGKSQCTVITVDVSTVIIIQELEEIVHDKSAENLILKLVALSLQYSCCWVLLYQKKSNQSEYSLSGDILHGICLIYAAIIPLTAKSEDVEIKVLISSGVDATGSLIHRILDYTLMLCKSDPYKWLDRSWLSPLISEAEKVLLSFPCINPMVAQLLLCRGSSLQWLLSATHDQLKELFPEVPLKILKALDHFTHIHASDFTGYLSSSSIFTIRKLKVLPCGTVEAQMEL
ncbi:hypothetical protein GDO78_006783 [Eleutherodactylus coqui]|uniref:Shortage in chiasmata 1 n=1 Tax=Eleutherodactylus coqui TaxID=57060 RepID=A0A8J6KB93_ELECQ|nr:hypothetical protein GDO78_006783 [Eleutherodactylus coqui]